MAIFNVALDEAIIKIVYYGPARGGKTTNLEYIYNKSDPETRGKLISMRTETDRTLFFDLLPMNLGKIRGMNIKLQLYTTPGQVQLSSTRKLVLKGVDAVVFVADSQKDQVEANLESLEDLKINLSESGLDIDSIPIVFQYNKRDLPDITPVEEMESILNPMGLDSFSSSAINGEGVFETLKCVSKKTIEKIQSSKIPIATSREINPHPLKDILTKPPKNGNGDLSKAITELEDKILDARRTLNRLSRALSEIEEKLSDSNN
ncbi:MAG: gliding-motility protein MglA [Candidatus Schekmanbacteria bacterium]|nr:MAG: gliding-motility protein MglA [Candidatus Schekmanbacteria bacterium]